MTPAGGPSSEQLAFKPLPRAHLSWAKVPKKGRVKFRFFKLDMPIGAKSFNLIYTTRYQRKKVLDVR
jgi:hypothetical protein